LSRLAFRLIEEQPFLLELARPIVSTRGVAEVVPVRRRAAQVEPIAGDEWSPHTLARADGWILVPAESEGLSAGSRVQMRAWP
jgi:molybdopterin biosynthesis enzyme